MWNFSDIMRPKMATCMYSCMHVCAHVRYDMSCRQNSIAAKWNIFLSFGLKVPFGFPCLANVCLSISFGFCLFLNCLRDFGCRAPFFSLVLLPAFLQGFIQSVSVPPLHHVTLRGGRACMFLYEWMDGVSDFAAYAWLHFLPGQSTCCKFQKCFKQSCKNELVFMRQTPSKVNKSWNCLRFLLRFAFGLGKFNKTNNPSISFM